MWNDSCRTEPNWVREPSAIQISSMLSDFMFHKILKMCISSRKTTTVYSLCHVALEQAGQHDTNVQGMESEATSQWPLAIQWPHFESAFKNVGRRHHWIFVKRPMGSIQPRLRWHNKVFSKETLRSVGPFLVLGHQKQGDFKRPQASPAVFLETKSCILSESLSRNQSTSKVLWWEKS